MGRPGLSQTQRAALDAAFGRSGNASAAAREVGVSTDQAARHFAKQRTAGIVLQRGPTPAQRLRMIEQQLAALARDVRTLAQALDS